MSDEQLAELQHGFGAFFPPVLGVSLERLAAPSPNVALDGTTTQGKAKTWGVRAAQLSSFNVLAEKLDLKLHLVRLPVANVDHSLQGRRAPRGSMAIAE